MPELAKVLKEGNLEKDQNGKPIGKLVKIISDSPTDCTCGNNQGMGPHSDYRDIKAIFDLTCTEERGAPVYRGYSTKNIIKIGNSINFSTDLYSIEGIITGVER